MAEILFENNYINIILHKNYMVTPSSILAKSSMNSIDSKPDQYGFMASYFDNVDDARKWIETV